MNSNDVAQLGTITLDKKHRKISLMNAQFAFWSSFYEQFQNATRKLLDCNEVYFVPRITRL